MDVILISFAICVLGVMVTVLLFSLAMRPEEEASDSPKRAQPPADGFFLEERVGQTTDPDAPNNALLLDLERHVRTEVQAAEAFLRVPTPDSLHAPSDSPLWN